MAFLFLGGKIPCKFYPYFSAPKTTLAASAAEVVTSDNVVGYTKINIAMGQTILGVQFQDVGNAGLDIQKIASDDFSNRDLLRFWNGEKYVNYYYAKFDPNDDESGLFDDDDNWLKKSGWGDASQYESLETIPAGEGFWLRTAKPATVSISGEVPDVKSISFDVGLNLISYPFPQAVDITKIASDDFSNRDQLRFWDGEKYVNYYYAKFDPNDDESGLFDDDDNWLKKSGWGDASQYEKSVTIPVGEGFWIRAAKSGTISFE